MGTQIEETVGTVIVEGLLGQVVSLFRNNPGLCDSASGIAQRLCLETDPIARMLERYKGKELPGITGRVLTVHRQPPVAGAIRVNRRNQVYQLRKSQG